MDATENNYTHGKNIKTFFKRFIKCRHKFIPKSNNGGLITQDFTTEKPKFKIITRNRLISKFRVITFPT